MYLHGILCYNTTKIFLIGGYMLTKIFLICKHNNFMIDIKAFYKLSYGLYVVSSVSDDKLNAQIANTIFQITSDPAMVAVSINKKVL